MSKVTDLEIDYSGLSHETNLITWILKSREPFSAVVREIQRGVIIEAGSEKCFEDGERGPWVKGCRWPLEAGEVQETDLLLESPERNAALPTSLL